MSGAVAGINRVLIGHPFDTLKVRLQTGGQLFAGTSSLQASVASLYRGILPPLFSVGMSTSTNFGIYENTRLTMIGALEDPEDMWAHVAIEWLAGTVAGSIMATATIPLENAKVIQQTSSKQRGTISWLRVLYQARGISALYRGYFPHLLQAGCGRGFYLSAYFMIKALLDGKLFPNLLPARVRTRMSSDTVTGKIVAAACAGVSGWAFTYPFDVARSNMMRDWRVEHHTSTLGCMRALVEAGGLGKLYAGFGFTILRAIPVACVALPSYDITRRVLLRALSGEEGAVLQS